jgi:transcriptional regulator with XRE-family HTH domain
MIFSEALLSGGNLTVCTVDQNDLRRVFGTNLRRLRESRGFSQQDLASKAGVNRTYLSRLENSANYVGLEIIGKMASVLEVEPADLLRQPPH